MDSYYQCKDVREFLRHSRTIYTSSANPERFGVEVKRLHPVGSVDKTGEWRGIYNDNTGETLIYHFDPQKGVGKKYNLGWEFPRSEDKIKIRDALNSGEIQVYDFYKCIFSVFDQYNKGLHDGAWPFKRGGGAVGNTGDHGSYHDFIMACILKNTYSAYYHLHKLDSPFNSQGHYKGSLSYRQMCKDIAVDLCKFSFDIVE